VNVRRRTKRPPVAEARVTLYGGGVFYGSSLTDDDGVASFTAVPAFTAGKLTAWRHNYLPTADEDVDVPGE